MQAQIHARPVHPLPLPSLLGLCLCCILTMPSTLAHLPRAGCTRAALGSHQPVPESDQSCQREVMAWAVISYREHTCDGTADCEAGVAVLAQALVCGHCILWHSAARQRPQSQHNGFARCYLTSPSSTTVQSDQLSSSSVAPFTPCALNLHPRNQTPHCCAPQQHAGSPGCRQLRLRDRSSLAHPEGSVWRTAARHRRRPPAAPLPSTSSPTHNTRGGRTVYEQRDVTGHRGFHPGSEGQEVS